MEREIPLVDSGARCMPARRNATARAPGSSQRLTRLLLLSGTVLLATGLVGPGMLLAQHRPDAGHVLEGAPATPAPPARDAAAALPTQDQRPVLDLPDSSIWTRGQNYEPHLLP